MPWNTPNTSWNPNDVVGASDMNEIGENLAYLKAMPSDLYLVNEGTDYSTTSTSFADVDSGGGSDLSLTITTAGGDVLIGFTGSFVHSAGNFSFLDVSIDGTRAGLDDGLAGFLVGTSLVTFGFIHLKTGLSAGAHTFVLQWRTASGTFTMRSGAGTANGDIHPQFFVKEIG